MMNFENLSLYKHKSCKPQNTLLGVFCLVGHFAPLGPSLGVILRVSTLLRFCQGVRTTCILVRWAVRFTRAKDWHLLGLFHGDSLHSFLGYKRCSACAKGKRFAAALLPNVSTLLWSCLPRRLATLKHGLGKSL